MTWTALYCSTFCFTAVIHSLLTAVTRCSQSFLSSDSTDCIFVISSVSSRPLWTCQHNQFNFATSMVQHHRGMKFAGSGKYFKSSKGIFLSQITHQGAQNFQNNNLALKYLEENHFSLCLLLVRKSQFFLAPTPNQHGTSLCKTLALYLFSSWDSYGNRLSESLRVGWRGGVERTGGAGGRRGQVMIRLQGVLVVS